MVWTKKNKGNSRFFVSIGAGLNQLPLIIEAKKNKFNVIGVDKNATAPGFIHCDLKIQESINNYRDIYTKLQELLVDGNIIGIMTKSYGDAIVTTSYLTEKFSIPFIPFETSKHFLDKKKMKDSFKTKNILTPKSFHISKNSSIPKSLTRALPVMSKPKFGHAKIDVKLVESTEELEKIIKNSNKENPIVFEEFIKGNEIIVAGIIHKNKFHLIDITDKKTTPHPYFVDLMHSSPSKYNHLSSKISKIGQLVADAFDLKTAPLIMEFIVTEDEDLYLIEAVPEFGGEFIPDILIPNKMNYNFICQTIKAMTNTGFKTPVRKKSKDAVVVKYITGKTGTLVSCNPDGPDKIEQLIFSRIFKVIGSKVKTPHTNHDRIGVVVAKGKSLDEAISTADQAIESLNIRIK